MKNRWCFHVFSPDHGEAYCKPLNDGGFRRRSGPIQDLYSCIWHIRYADDPLEAKVVSSGGKQVLLKLTYNLLNYVYNNI